MFAGAAGTGAAYHARPGGWRCAHPSCAPCHKPDRETPFTAILNGQDILPLNVSWAILLTNFIEALKPYTGKEIRPERSAINAQAVAATRYRKTEYAQIESDLKTLVDCLCTIARGGSRRLD